MDGQTDRQMRQIVKQLYSAHPLALNGKPHMQSSLTEKRNRNNWERIATAVCWVQQNVETLQNEERRYLNEAMRWYNETIMILVGRFCLQMWSWRGRRKGRLTVCHLDWTRMSGRRAEMLNFGRNLALEEEKGILRSSGEGASSLTTKNYNVFPRREHSYVLQHPSSTASSFQTTTSNEILNVRILPTEANIGHRR